MYPTGCDGASKKNNQTDSGMIEKCSRCGSSNAQEINLEMAFARGTAPPVYALGRPLVCLDCGLAEITIPAEPLAELRDGIPSQTSV